MTSLLLLGVSGQVGGPFLTSFLQQYPEIAVTVFLRSTAYDEVLRGLNVAAAHGTYDDTNEVQQLVSRHNIIINVGSSWNTALTEAILRGAHVNSGEKKKILIHMSGAGNFTDYGKSGNIVSQAKPWNDANPEDVRKVNPTMLNGACDELVLKAASAGVVNGFIICPGGIYGLGSKNDVTDGTSPPSLGVWATWMVQNVTNLGFSPYVGEGTAVFPTIHVDDVVQLMFLIFEKALNTWDSYKPEDAYKNFYLGIDERYGGRTLATAFADFVSKTRKLDIKTKQVNFEEAGTVAR